MMYRSRQKSWPGRKYEAPRSNLPNEFREMKFADYQKIRFLTEKAEWADQKTPFKLSFYHQGMHFDTPVKINEITANTVEEIKYDPSRFDFGDVKFDPKATEQLGYAGFRVLYPVNKADKQDEIMTMLGRELLPRGRQGARLRLVRSRHGDRYRTAVRRRVPAFSRVLDSTAETGRQAPGDLRPAGFATAPPAPIA